MTPLQQIATETARRVARSSKLSTRDKLWNMPIAYSMVLTLNNAEIAQLRRQLYAMNRTTLRQYYTRRCGRQLYVFRVM